MHHAVPDLAASPHARSTWLYPLPHPIQGGCAGGDFGLITTVISGTALCVECIARQTGVPGAEVSEALSTIAGTFQLGNGDGRCHGCLQSKPAYSLIGDVVRPVDLVRSSPAAEGTSLRAARPS